MLNQPIKRRMNRMLIGTAMLIGAALLPPGIQSQETPGTPAAPSPVIVRARQGDTLATLGRRYLNDASMGWMIGEYNGITVVDDGQAILIPVAPFRPGGLAPDGYQHVPVLAYADIGPSPGCSQCVSGAEFNRQMHWLKSQGFTAITPAQLVAFMAFSGQLPRRSVLITFDTASRALDEIGIPVLTELGFTATVFVATDSVGQKGAMTWDRIRQLQQNGFTIACRGRSGRSLARRTQRQTFEAYFKAVASELHLARQEIETHLDTPCLFLAYPRGDTNSLVSAMAAKLGFSAAFTQAPGENPFFGDRFGIHRTVIDSRVGPEQFGKLLTTLIAADLN